jgi:threonine synthase
VRRLRESGWIAESETVVLLNTGTGLKYPDTVHVEVPVLEPGEAIPDGKVSEPRSELK